MTEIFLTGLGAITSRGDVTLNGASTLSLEGTANFQIENFALENYLASPKTYLDRASALALAGCALALRDAEISWPADDEDFGIALGTHLGCLETMKTFWDKTIEKGARLANPLLFSHSYFNSPISLCAIEFGLKGYHATFCAREYSGLEAVRAAFDAIRLGHAAAMLCGAVEAFSATRASGENEESSSEASVFFVLESAAHAAQRSTASPRAVDETWFQNAETQLESAREIFGACGGALSTLALMRALSAA